MQPLRFYYLIRDDLFQQNERTKFFDYILPVVPVMSKGNSYGRVIEIFSKYPRRDLLKDEVLENLSYYINDMRTLKNVYNEFIIYINSINISLNERTMLLDENVLLCIIFYKNLFPEDYKQMHDGKGFLANAVAKRNEFIKLFDEEKDNLPEEITKLFDTDLTTTEIDCFVSNDSFNLIVYFMKHNLIDRGYENYLSHFVPGSLTTDDLIFIRNLNVDSQLVPSHNLNNVANVIARLKKEDFKKDSILNFKLLSYLLNNGYDEQSISLLVSVKNNGNLDFIKEFIIHSLSSDNDEIKLVVKISEIWPEFIIDILFRFETLPLQWYLRTALSVLSYEKLQELNTGNSLTDFISSQTNLLNIIINKPNIADNMEQLGVKFRNIDFNVEINDIFDEVYDRNLYELSLHNIESMLENYHGIKAPNEIKWRSYSLIKSTGESQLLNYIEENIKVYLEIILQQENTEFKDDEEYVLDLLNNEELLDVGENENDWLKEYIERMQTKISDISKVKHIKLWNKILKEKLLVYNLTNIYEFFIQPDMESFESKDFINFVNSESIELDFKNIHDEMKKCIEDDFMDEIVRCNSLNNERYQHFIESIGLYYQKFDFDSIDFDKMKILIDTKTIKLAEDAQNKEILDFIRKKYNHEIFDCFVIKNFNYYKELLHEQKLDLNIELNYLLEKFSIFSSENKGEITEIVKQNIEFISEMLTQQENLVFSVELLDKLLAIPAPTDGRRSHFKFKREHKIKLVVATVFPKRDKNLIEKYLKKIGNSELENWNGNSANKRYADTTENRMILEALKSNEMIFNYEIDDKNGKFKIIKNSNDQGLF